MIVYRSCPGCGDGNIFKVFSARDETVSKEFFDIWECKNCSLRFTQNVPGEQDIGKYYQSESYISHTDTDKGLINFLYHRVRKRTLLQKRKLIENTTGKKPGNILDIGAGTGAFLNVMQKEGWNITGIEPDETARKKALELYGINLKEAEKLYSLPPGSFDAITLWHVLEHVHELHNTIAQLKALLASNGKLFIAVPNFTSADAQTYKQFWAAYDVPRHLYHFSPSSMKGLLNEHGLTVEKIKPMWFDSFYVSLLSEKYKTGKPNPVRAVFNGSISNLKAFFDPEKCSSLLYIVSL